MKGRCLAGEGQPCPVKTDSADPCPRCDHWEPELVEEKSKPITHEVPFGGSCISLAGAKVQTDAEFLHDLAKRIASVPACYSVGGGYDIRRLMNLASKLNDE